MGDKNKLGVLGATGRTGRQVIEQAVDRGRNVVAVSRTGGAMPAGVEVRVADVLDLDGMRHALTGCSQAISALGVGSSRAATNVYSDGIANTLAAEVMHVVAVSAAPVGDVAQLSWTQRSIAIPILRRVFRETYADMAKMEATLADSAATWTVLRPPRLIDREPRGRYYLRPGGSIATGDLATALLDALDRPDWNRQLLNVCA